MSRGAQCGVSAADQGVDIRNVTVIDATGAQSFMFDRLGIDTHVVTVGPRRFQVRLLGSRDESMQPQLWKVTYDFAISEQ